MLPRILICCTLLWQVRVIVERLARRCGYDTVAAAIPEGDRKLLAHIRKERLRKDGRRRGDAASEVRHL
jgi:ribosomal RNA-processing protein 12